MHFWDLGDSPGGHVLIALSFIVTATLTGMWVARRAAGKAGMLLLIASGMLLTTAALHILPDAWGDAPAVGLSRWVVAGVAVLGYGVMTVFTKNGCGCDADLASQVVGAHAPGRHRKAKEVAGALSVGMGAATALTVHRVVEGSAVVLDVSAAVLLALVIGSVSDGLALATLLQETGQRLAPWAVVACASPALGVLITSISPLPAPALPIALSLVAGVILRIAWVGLRLAAKKRASGQLPRWQIVTAATTVTLSTAVMIAH
ncbi:hypothetical protein OHT20_17555 [Streptomyces caniferus]|uniref:hypothetical protein n=1 Tax=Streptomyces caniferus TaxID=285557 RepID=UPI002E2856FF|nr:hypothetical protein [Streptomyces caniferus]